MRLWSVIIFCSHLDKWSDWSIGMIPSIVDAKSLIPVILFYLRFISASRIFFYSFLKVPSYRSIFHLVLLLKS